MCCTAGRWGDEGDVRVLWEGGEIKGMCCTVGRWRDEGDVLHYGKVGR